MASAFRPGDTLAGKYRVDAIMGSGGMGVVLAATHLHLDEPVAIKVLHKHLLDAPGSQERFFQEARAATKINHPNCVQVKDVDILPDGTPYIVMELLRGESLADKLKRKGKLHFREAVNLVTQACDALQQAHRLGVVHRDLKPANLFVTPRPDGSEHLKVLDFGVSKVAIDSIVRMQSPETTFTETNVLLGSPKYMAPEQMASPKGVGPEADVWSLGCILYLALTGEPPFDGPTVFAICSAVLRDEPARPGTLAAMPDEIEKAIVRALQKNPRERFASVADLREALLRCVVVDALQSSMTTPAPLAAGPKLADRIVQMRNGEIPSLAGTDVTNFVGSTISHISMVTADSILSINTLKDAAPPIHDGSLGGTRSLSASDSLGGTRSLSASDSLGGTRSLSASGSLGSAGSLLGASSILDRSTTGSASGSLAPLLGGRGLPFTAPDVAEALSGERTSALPAPPPRPSAAEIARRESRPGSLMSPEEVITATVDRGLDRASVGEGTLEGTFTGSTARPSYVPDFARRGRTVPIVVGSIVGLVAAAIFVVVWVSRPDGAPSDSPTSGTPAAAPPAGEPRRDDVVRTASSATTNPAEILSSKAPSTAVVPLVLEGAPAPITVDEATAVGRPGAAAPARPPTTSKPNPKKDPFGGSRK